MDKIRKSLNTNNSAFSMVSISCSLVTRFHQIFFKTAPRIATKIPICHTAIRSEGHSISGRAPGSTVSFYSNTEEAKKIVYR